MKDKFLEQCQEMGMDFMEVNDFLEEKGIPECNIELVIDYIKDSKYVNRLKKGKSERSNEKRISYEYFDPSQ